MAVFVRLEEDLSLKGDKRGVVLSSPYVLVTTDRPRSGSKWWRKVELFPHPRLFNELAHLDEVRMNLDSLAEEAFKMGFEMAREFPNMKLDG